MLNISLLQHGAPQERQIALVKELLRVEYLHQLYIIDNSPTETKWPISSTQFIYIWNKGQRLLYSAAHNIALRDSIYDDATFHLILDLDMEVKAEDINRLYLFMWNNPLVGIVAPKVLRPDGEVCPTARLLPTVLKTLSPRVLPHDKMINVPALDGCFLITRTEAVHKAGLLDEQLDDIGAIDLTRTVHRDYLTVFVPDISVTTYKEPYKRYGLKDLYRYFRKWGFVFDRERSMMNRLSLQQLK